MDEEDEVPTLTAVSSSARQLYLLLRCINFAEKAHVQISDEGLRFSVDEASVMEASAFLAKDLFTTYTYRAPTPPSHHSDSEDDEEGASLTLPNFQISLPSLLETLQIFGLTDPTNSSKPPWQRTEATSTAFSNNVLGMNNLCRILYMSPGGPLTVILTEATIRTSCDLTCYEAAFSEEIPFDRSSLAFKTIMRGGWLGDAIAELSSTSPEKLTLWARMKERKPYFALSSSGTLGSARVEFNNHVQSRAAPVPSSTSNPPGTPPPPASLLETFKLGSPSSPLKASYKFSLIQRAMRAMSAASKVSIRVDEQGVLSLQFMIEVEAGKLSFIDFRFVPLVEDDNEEGEGDETMLGVGEGSMDGDTSEGDEDENEVLM
ncbi:Rad1-domain-containing protein [Massarina eburnea CBS 473.64]|uniref:Rad1-domain-containing protein n=1 Tax=Massarina eburnea CBS 473.64 TaxID=1395130 RepID=A0A6A6RT83_9PLEO|nr:Rad1-domain-containing protein [Massarina eburnea CBS 473.64]